MRYDFYFIAKKQKKNKMNLIFNLFFLFEGDSFGRRNNLLAHKLRHGEKKYDCKKCNKKFTTSTGLRQHEKWNHRDKTKNN